DVAIAVCEDLWQEGGPVTVTREAGAQLLVVPNASPYERGKDDVRLELVARRAREAGAALAYVNMVGGQDELIFDGDSVIVDAALGLVVRDYIRKNGFRSVSRGLSGCIDSALVATIAADAIGPSNVHAVLMPSRYSSDHSVTDADELVKRQGLHGRTVPIRDI